MDKLSLIRHGDKLKAGQERVPLREANLTDEQRVRWQSTCERLGLNDPEVTYESLEKMEVLAKAIYDSLPERTLVIFTATNYPRTRFTAEYVLATLEQLTQRKQEKTIYTEVLGDSQVYDGVRTIGTSSVAMEAPGMIDRMKAILAQDASDDAEVADYLSHPGGGKGHAKEMEIFLRAVNADLQSADSFLKKRAKKLREEVGKVKELVATNHGLPVYFFGVGHMSSLIALGVAFGNRNHYDSVEEMPTPLSLREVAMK